MASRLLLSAAMRSLFDTVDRMESAMTFHRERQSVLAGNLANIDTPGYVPLDLARVDAGDGGAAPKLEVFADPAGGVGPDGNAVSLERELAKIDANRVRYGVSAQLCSRRLALLRYAAGDGT